MAGSKVVPSRPCRGNAAIRDGDPSGPDAGVSDAGQRRTLVYFLVGAAPNAIAYASGQFTTKEFFLTGLPASALLLVVLAVFVWFIWPLMGMPVLAT